MAYQVDEIIQEILQLDFNSLKDSKIIKIELIVEKLIILHAADIAEIFNNIKEEFIYPIFNKLSPSIQADVFMEFSEDKRKFIFVKCTKNEKEILLSRLTIDEQVDFFDELSDEELSRYIKLLSKKEREKVLSILEYPETTAGRIMDTNVFVLSKDMNVKKTIYLLQRLKLDRIINRTIFIVNLKYELIGTILLEDLILNKPETQISDFMQKIIYKVDANMDQEEVASYMIHYHIDVVPVINEKAVFLGIISSDTLAEVLEDEASEDIFRMASLSPIEGTYFESSILELVWQRGRILITLLLLQSISTMIIGHYQSIIATFLIAYIGMITSTGGNASSQVSVFVIQGLANKEIREKQMKKFIKRELCIASILGIILSTVGFFRIYLFHRNFYEGFIVGLSLVSVVIISTLLGSITPFFLRKLNIDPAYAAGPLLATFMDIIGVVIFVFISINFMKFI